MLFKTITFQGSKCAFCERVYVADRLIWGGSFHHPVNYNTKISDVIFKGKCFCVLIPYQTLYQQKKSSFSEADNTKPYACACLECCLRTVKQWRHLKTISTKWAQPLILFHLVFQSRLYACFPQHIFDVRDASLQVVWFESWGNKCTQDPILWQLWCSPQWSGWAGWGRVPNANWNSISASSASKIPHLSLREAAWKMWDIIFFISFHNPLLQVAFACWNSVWGFMVWGGTTVRNTNLLCFNCENNKYY